jgi:hypothetical protein
VKQQLAMVDGASSEIDGYAINTDAANGTSRLERIVMAENTDSLSVRLSSELFEENGIYEIEATAFDFAGNYTGKIIHTYVVMRGDDVQVMAFVPGETLEGIHRTPKQARDIPPIPIHKYVVDGAGFYISVGYDDGIRSRILELGSDYELVSEVANGVMLHVTTIPTWYLENEFPEEGQDYDVPIYVRSNPSRDIAFLMINNGYPTGEFGSNVRDGIGFYGVDVPYEVQVINLSEGINEDTTRVIVNGQVAPFTYNADDKTITFVLDKSPAVGLPLAGCNINVVLVSMNGLTSDIEVSNVYVGSWIGRYWIFFAVGGVLLISAAVFVIVKHKKKKADD